MTALIGVYLHWLLNQCSFTKFLKFKANLSDFFLCTQVTTGIRDSAGQQKLLLISYRNSGIMKYNSTTLCMMFI